MTRATDWVEIMPGDWINLKRANRIRLSGSAVQIDGENYAPKATVIEAISRWLRQREMPPMRGEVVPAEPAVPADDCGE